MNLEEKLAADLRSLKSMRDDPETVHGDADDLLLRYFRDKGYEDVVTAYEELVDACEWWACA